MATGSAKHHHYRRYYRRRSTWRPPLLTWKQRRNMGKDIRRNRRRRLELQTSLVWNKPVAARGDTDDIFLRDPDLTVRMKSAEEIEAFPYLNGMTVRVVCSVDRASEEERFRMYCGIMARRDRLEFVVVDVDEDDEDD